MFINKSRKWKFFCKFDITYLWIQFKLAIENVWIYSFWIWFDRNSYWIHVGQIMQLPKRRNNKSRWSNWFFLLWDNIKQYVLYTTEKEKFYYWNAIIHRVDLPMSLNEELIDSIGTVSTITFDRMEKAEKQEMKVEEKGI